MLKIKNGKFELAGTIWTVLEQTEQGFLCIADSIGDKVFGKTNDWRESNIRKFLNTEFLEKIENEIGKENVIEFERNLLSLDGQTEYGTCMDKVSIISAFEYIKHRKVLPNTEKWWWTLTPDSTPCNNDNYWVRVVSSSGDFGNGSCYCCYYGVRPVCILKSNIFVSKDLCIEGRIKNMTVTLESLEKQFKKLEKDFESLKANLNKPVIKKNLGIGDTFEIAGLKWKILDITDEGYMCLAEKLEEKMKFDSNSNNWTNSSLRAFLHKDIYNKIADEIGANNIIPFERDLLSLDGQTEYGTCEDKVSLLPVDEYRKYRNLIPNTDDYWWWLITPWSTPCNDYGTSVAVVSSSGRIGNGFCDCSYGGGVRPVCILKSNIFVSKEK